jgi:hypothetical protein
MRPIFAESDACPGFATPIFEDDWSAIDSSPAQI